MTKKYKLLKDLPTCKTGEIFTWDCGRYRSHNKNEIYLDSEVENNPTWFEEIKEEQPFQWSDELVYEFCFWQGKVKAEEIERFKEINGFPTRKQQTNTIPSGEKYKQWDIPMNATIKESQPKTERRIVTEFRVYNKHPLENSYQFDTSHHIEKEKLPLIKKAIEKILNNE